MQVDQETLAKVKAMCEEAETPLEYCMADIIMKLINDAEGEMAFGSMAGYVESYHTINSITKSYKQWHEDHA